METSLQSSGTLRNDPFSDEMMEMAYTERKPELWHQKHETKEGFNYLLWIQAVRNNPSGFLR